MKTCKDCIYYDDSYDGEYGDAVCRRYPPNGYNITKKDEWCGELHAKEWGQPTYQTDILNALYEILEAVRNS